MISVQNQIILKQVVVPSLGFGSCSGGNNDFEALSISSLDVLKRVIFTLKCNGAYGDPKLRKSLLPSASGPVRCI